MSAFLDKSGLTHLWGKITSYINSKIADVSTLYGTATVESSGSVECNIDPDTFVDAIRAGKRAVVTLATTTDADPLVFATWFSSGDYFADAVVLATTSQAYTLKVHRLFATKSGGGSWRYVTYTTNAMRDSNASGADGTVPVFSAEDNRWEPELLTPLIGSTSSITPAQVAEAVEGGRLVVLTDNAEGATGTKVAQWAVSGSGSMVRGLCSWDISQGDADQAGQVTLTELVGYLDNRGWVHSRLEGAILPQVDASDNGKVLMSSNGAWTLGTPSGGGGKMTLIRDTGWDSCNVGQTISLPDLSGYDAIGIQVVPDVQKSSTDRSQVNIFPIPESGISECMLCASEIDSGTHFAELVARRLTISGTTLTISTLGHFLNLPGGPPSAQLCVPRTIYGIKF